jgi:Domain of unknown function (DUF4383)
MTTAPGARARTADRADYSPAQIFCLVVGVTLVLVGLVGFIAESDFSPDAGSDLIIFEVNGVHNLVHLFSGLLLLAVFRRRDLARTIAFAFGAIYLVVTIIGFADGSDILGLFPIDAEDNVLHLLLTLAAFGAALASPPERYPATTDRTVSA